MFYPASCCAHRRVEISLGFVLFAVERFSSTRLPSIARTRDGKERCSQRSPPHRMSCSHQSHLCCVNIEDAGHLKNVASDSAELLNHASAASTRGASASGMVSLTSGIGLPYLKNEASCNLSRFYVAGLCRGEGSLGGLLVYKLYRRIRRQMKTAFLIKQAELFMTPIITLLRVEVGSKVMRPTGSCKYR